MKGKEFWINLFLKLNSTTCTFMNFLPHYTQTISDNYETLKGKRGFGNGQWSLIGRELFLKEIKNCFCFDYFQVDGFKMSLSQPVESCWPLWDMIPASV